jgi:hypothetical protein
LIQQPQIRDFKNPGWNRDSKQPATSPMINPRPDRTAAVAG